MSSEFLMDNLKEVKSMLIGNKSHRFIAKHFNVTLGCLSGFIYRNLKNVNTISRPKKQQKREIYIPMVIEFEVNQCKFLTGDRPYIQCESDRIKDSPYCKEHHDICYMKNTKNIKVVDKAWEQK